MKKLSELKQQLLVFAGAAKEVASEESAAWKAEAGLEPSLAANEQTTENTRPMVQREEQKQILRKQAVMLKNGKHKANTNTHEERIQVFASDRASSPFAWGS